MPHLPTWLQSVHHDGSDAFVSNPYPRLGDTVRIRLRAGVDAPIRRVFVRTAPDGEQAFRAHGAGGRERARPLVAG